MATVVDRPAAVVVNAAPPSAPSGASPGLPHLRFLGIQFKARQERDAFKQGFFVAVLASGSGLLQAILAIVSDGSPCPAPEGDGSGSGDRGGGGAWVAIGVVIFLISIVLCIANPACLYFGSKQRNGGLLCTHCATSICFVVFAALFFLGSIWSEVTCDASKEWQGIAGTGTVSQGDREACCVPGSSMPTLILTLICIPCLSINIYNTSHIKNLMTGMPSVGGAQPMSTVAQPVVAVAQPVTVK